MLIEQHICTQSHKEVLVIFLHTIIYTLYLLKQLLLTSYITWLRTQNDRLFSACTYIGITVRIYSLAIDSKVR